MGSEISRDEIDGWMAQQEHKARTTLEARVRLLERELESERKRAKGLQSMNSSLAAKVDRQRAWKESAMTLLTRYDNLAETFDGKLGSSKVTNLENGVAALRVEVDRQQVVVEAAKDMSEHGCGECEAKLDEAIAAYEASREGANGHNDHD